MGDDRDQRVRLAVVTAITTAASVGILSSLWSRHRRRVSTLGIFSTSAAGYSTSAGSIPDRADSTQPVNSRWDASSRQTDDIPPAPAVAEVATPLTGGEQRPASSPGQPETTGASPAEHTWVAFESTGQLAAAAAAASPPPGSDSNTSEHCEQLDDGGDVAVSGQPAPQVVLPPEDSAARAQARSNLASIYSTVGAALPPKQRPKRAVPQRSPSGKLALPEQPPLVADGTHPSAAPADGPAVRSSDAVAAALPQDDPSASAPGGDVSAQRSASEALLSTVTRENGAALPLWQRLLALTAAGVEADDERDDERDNNDTDAGPHEVSISSEWTEGSAGKPEQQAEPERDATPASELRRPSAPGLPPMFPRPREPAREDNGAGAMRNLESLADRGDAVADAVRCRSAEAQPEAKLTPGGIRTASGTEVRMQSPDAAANGVRADAALAAWPPSLGEEQARTASPFKPYRPSTPQLRSGGGEHSRIMSSASTATSGELPFSDWEVEGEALEVCRHPDGTPIVLGQGSFGTVYQALSHGVQPVAVKVFPLTASAEQHAEFQREVVLLKSCRDGNIVQFLGASQTDEQTLMILEYMENGDLFSALRKVPAGELLWYRRGVREDGCPVPGQGRQIALDVARGLHFLHRHFVVHFDLKSPNILLGRHNIAKIADVGLAKILQKDYISSLQSVGTFAWSAPEILLGARCTEKVDIYGFGTIMWELVTGESPARGRLRPVRVPEECPASIAQLIDACLDHKPANRPSAKELVGILNEQGRSLEQLRSSRIRTASPVNSRGTDSDCSEELVEAIVALARVIGGPASGITNEEAVEAARFRDDLKIQKAYIRELQRCLTSETVWHPDSPARQRLVKLVEAQRTVMMLFMRERSSSTRRFQFLGAQEGNEPAGRAPPRGNGASSAAPNWSQLLEAMQLTEDQKQSIAAARRVVTDRLRKIGDERKRLMAALHTFVLEQPGGAGFSTAVDQSDALKSNLENEAVLLQDFHIVFTCKTLTPLQQAQLEVACFPQLPDALEVCRIVASQQAGHSGSEGPPAQQGPDTAKRIAAVTVKRTPGSSVRAVSA